MRFLFAHISWMPEYSGKAGEKLFSTHSYVVENRDAGEKANFKLDDGKYYGYVRIRDKKSGDHGQIAIEKLGANNSDNFVDNITVIWFANNPIDSNQAYIVGWYHNARLFRNYQLRKGRGYRTSCSRVDATLLKENSRKFPIPHVQSRRGRELGYGYGHSSIWYAEKASEAFFASLCSYIESVEKLNSSESSRKVVEVADALDDLDDSDVGNRNPRRTKKYGTVIARDPEVRRRVINRARGRCEYCGALGFEKEDGSRFVEAHHIIHLSQQGPDTLENVIGLCPNHHRQAHFGQDREAFEEDLKSKLRQLRNER